MIRVNVVVKLMSSMTNAMHVLLDSFTFLYAKSVSLDVLLMNYVLWTLFAWIFFHIFYNFGVQIWKKDFFGTEHPTLTPTTLYFTKWSTHGHGYTIFVNSQLSRPKDKNNLILGLFWWVHIIRTQSLGTISKLLTSHIHAGKF